MLCAISQEKLGAKVVELTARLYSLSHPSQMSNGARRSISLAQISSRLQNFTIDAFVALFAIAGMQAILALYEYRSNPAGGLVVPPGPTCGIENMKEDPLSKMEIQDSLKNNDTDLDRSSELIYSIQSDIDEHKAEKKIGKVRSFFREIKRFLVFLLPWLSKEINFILKKRTHLAHIGFIMSVVSVLDIRPFGGIHTPSTDNFVTLNASKENLNLIVIGDSFACGVGCFNKWNKAALSAPIERIENYITLEKRKTNQNNLILDEGPAFPQSFARTLSLRLKRPISWRSAGVDGGDLNAIRTHCVGIIEEEVNEGKVPDVVVVLGGLNDLKKIIAKPLRSGSAGDFRSSIKKLIDEIHKHAPRSKIIFPAIPTYKLDNKSIVNIFPLSFFLGVLISLWDWQKKKVAYLYPASVKYFSLSGAEIAKWYKRQEKIEASISSNTLIAADGIHPSRRCYAFWGESMANKYCDWVVGPNNMI